MATVLGHMSFVSVGEGFSPTDVFFKQDFQVLDLDAEEAPLRQCTNREVPVRSVNPCGILSKLEQLSPHVADRFHLKPTQLSWLAF